MSEGEESQCIFTAKRAGGTIIFIGDAQSGKNGYFCRGCGFEMVARIGRHNIAHFAHAVRDVEQKALCRVYTGLARKKSSITITTYRFAYPIINIRLWPRKPKHRPKQRMTIRNAFPDRGFKEQADEN